MNKYYDLYTQKFYKSPKKHTNCSKNYEQPSYDPKTSGDYDISSLYVYNSNVEADFKNYLSKSDKGNCDSSNIDKTSNGYANSCKGAEGSTYDSSHSTSKNRYENSSNDLNNTENKDYCASYYDNESDDFCRESTRYPGNNSYVNTCCCEYNEPNKNTANSCCNNSYMNSYSGEYNCSSDDMEFCCNDFYKNTCNNSCDLSHGKSADYSCNNSFVKSFGGECGDSSYKESSNCSCNNSYGNTYSNECDDSYNQRLNYSCNDNYVNNNAEYCPDFMNYSNNEYNMDNNFTHNQMQGYHNGCNNDINITDPRGNIVCTQSYSDISALCADKGKESFYYEEHLKSDTQCNHISGNEVCECIKGNSLDVNIDKSDSDIRADLVLETKSIIRIWGQIKDCHGNTVGDAIVSLLKPGYIRGKLNYVCTATTVTDYMGFYQFELDNDYKDTVYRIIVSKPNK